MAGVVPGLGSSKTLARNSGRSRRPSPPGKWQTPLPRHGDVRTIKAQASGFLLVNWAFAALPTGGRDGPFEPPTSDL